MKFIKQQQQKQQKQKQTKKHFSWASQIQEWELVTGLDYAVTSF